MATFSFTVWNQTDFYFDHPQTVVREWKRIQYLGLRADISQPIKLGCTPRAIFFDGQNETMKLWD